jgi:type II secretory pathway component PulM
MISPRDKSIATAGGVVVGAMLVVALVWLPLERLRVRLAHELPVLRASVESLRHDAEEVRRVRALPPTMPGNPPPLAGVIASNAWGRDLPGVQITVPDEKHVRLVGDDIAFGQLLDWLTTAQAAHGLRVEKAKIEAGAMTGRVRADLTLARS